MATSLNYKAAPSAQAGLSLATGASSWAFGDYIEFIAASSSTKFISGIRIMPDVTTVTLALDTTCEVVIELTKGSGDTVIATIPFSYRIDTRVNHVHFFYPILGEPIEVEANVRIRGRIASSVNGTMTFTGIKIFYYEDVPQDVTLPVLSNTNSLYDQTISPQAVTITAPLLSNANTLYEPTVENAATAQNVTLPLYTNTNALYEPTVSPQAVSVVLPLYTNTSALYGPTISPQSVNVELPLYTNSSTLYSPSVSPQAVTITAPRIDNENTLYAPAVQDTSQNVSLPLFTNTSTLYEPSIVVGDVSIELPLQVSVNQIFIPTIDPQPVDVGLSKIETTSQLFTPTVSDGTQSLGLSFLVNTSYVYEPNIDGGGYEVRKDVDGDKPSRERENREKSQKQLNLKKDDELAMLVIQSFIRCQK